MESSFLKVRLLGIATFFKNSGAKTFCRGFAIVAVMLTVNI